MPEEILDVIDESDQVIRQAGREEIHVQGLTHRGVHIFLFTPEGTLVVQKRTRDRAQYPSLWDCSVSEHVKTGEDYEEAAVRGLREELGLSGVSLLRLLRFRLEYGPNDREISVLFTGCADPGLIRYDPEEIEQIASFPTEDLVDLMKNGEMKFCGWFIDLMQWYTGGTSEIEVLDTRE